jgi:glyoxylase-like metal-dependent hydrolase (beta-lactamase superfamily II)
MSLQLQRLTVGPWPMNAYLLVCETTGESAIVDPGAEPERLLASLRGTQVKYILITHAHPDHIGALEAVKAETGALVALHPVDGQAFNVAFDLPLSDEQIISLGRVHIRVIHAPGHTPGLCCFDLGDQRVLVGDAVFIGGPGHTDTPEDFSLTMQTMQQVVFAWSDEVIFYPGHGDAGRIGLERRAFETFLARGWSPELHGDVIWDLA